MASLYPEPAVRPGSITWRRASDPRLFLTAGYALLLQVAHPTVGSGVRDHSTFEQDPWGRLLRTVDYVNLAVYAGPDAAKVGPKLRAYHQAIKGINPDGGHYYALEPEAFAWVHATLADALVKGHEHFGQPLRPAEKEAMYREWLGIGRTLGIRPSDLPAAWSGFYAYFDEMVANRLVLNDTVDRVLRSLRTSKPPLTVLPRLLWTGAAYPAAHVLELATAGLLPPALRQRLGLSWNQAQAGELAALGAASRTLTPLLPQRLKIMGPDYLRLRRRQIARGPLSPAPARTCTTGGAGARG
jgi:uncharacterized protein (DUF2236 family)